MTHEDKKSMQFLGIGLEREKLLLIGVFRNMLYINHLFLVENNYLENYGFLPHKITKCSKHITGYR